MLTKLINFWSDPNTDYQCFSNFYYAPMTVEIKGKTLNFPTNEHYYMFCKALCFQDKEIAFELANGFNLSPKDAKKLGRKVKNFDEKIWNTVSYDTMRRGVWYKFSQNFRIKQILLDTGDSIIVEDSPYDRIWGVGVQNPSNASEFKGQNLLGEVLMEIRELLRNNEIWMADRIDYIDL